MEVRAEEWLKIIEDSTHENSGISPDDNPGELSYRGNRVDISTLLDGSSLTEMEKALQWADVNSAVFDVIEKSIIPGLKNVLDSSDKKNQICSALSAAYTSLSNAAFIDPTEAERLSRVASDWKSRARDSHPSNPDILQGATYYGRGGEQPMDDHNGLDYRDVGGKDRKPETPEPTQQTDSKEAERRRRIEEIRRQMDLNDQLSRGHSL